MPFSKLSISSRAWRPPIRARFVARALPAAIVFALVLTGAASGQSPSGQVTPKAAAEAAPQAVPGFWDPRRRPDRPDLSRITIIRFLTETDYPPFDYAGPDGNPVGFNVDLARLICEEIKASCTVQMRRFDTLIASLQNNSGDAVI